MTEELAYQIDIDVYKGPFDLLLTAIDEGKIDINQISIAQITSSYFQYFRAESPDLVLAAEFLVMAAYLIELKTRALLPAQPEFMKEEEISDVEGDLLRHLEEYKIYKGLAERLKQRKEYYSKVYDRQRGEAAEEGEIELVGVNLRDLVSAFKRVYDEAARREAVVAIPAEEVKLEDRIIEIKRMLAGRKDGVPFEDLFLRKTKLEVVVTFLAILELAKQKFIQVRQGRSFGSILIFGTGHAV